VGWNSSGRRNIHDTGFAEQWIEIHGQRITRIHMKDTMKHRGRCGQQSVYTNIFLGDNNWPAIREAIRKVNYDGWLIAEMESRLSVRRRSTGLRYSSRINTLHIRDFLTPCRPDASS